ncbi:hypothetical protein G5714_024618 [Onychostoma macrolepis]|uniref:Uncharacterized protein n=1 Tax=Onychostoma macrolepis TaxID=369639 RepID=A0A7J6BID0_9TELE|nr:hypothetical protein G5714_024618 [Onychostoma macrolepis]
MDHTQTSTDEDFSPGCSLFQQKTSEAESSCVSMRSDESIGHPVNFKSGDATTDLSSVHQKRSEAESSCVSMRSDASMSQIIDYKSEDTKTDLRHEVLNAFRSNLMKKFERLEREREGWQNPWQSLREQQRIQQTSTKETPHHSITTQHLPHIQLSPGDSVDGVLCPNTFSLPCCTHILNSNTHAFGLHTRLYVNSLHPIAVSSARTIPAVEKPARTQRSPADGQQHLNRAEAWSTARATGATELRCSPKRPK